MHGSNSADLLHFDSEIFRRIIIHVKGLGIFRHKYISMRNARGLSLLCLDFLMSFFFGSTTEAQVTSSSLVPYTLCAKRLVFPACFCVSLHTWYTLHLQRFLSWERRQDSVLEAEEEKGSYRPWHQKQTEEVSTSKIGNTTTTTTANARGEDFTLILLDAIKGETGKIVISVTVLKHIGHRKSLSSIKQWLSVSYPTI